VRAPRRTAAGAALLFALLASCGEQAPDTSSCDVEWDCGAEIYRLDCATGDNGVLACTCEKNASRTGTCEREGLCVDAWVWADESSEQREQALLNLKNNTIACCGYNVSTDASACSLRIE